MLTVTPTTADFLSPPANSRPFKIIENKVCHLLNSVARFWARLGATGDSFQKVAFLSRFRGLMIAAHYRWTPPFCHLLNSVAPLLGKN